MYYAKDYTENKYPFPEEINPTKKKREHCMRTAMAIYSKYVRNKCGVSYSALPSYRLLKLYGDGMQSEEIYKNYFVGDGSSKSEDATTGSDVDRVGGWTQPRKAKRKGYYNVLWKVISIAPKIKSALTGKFHNIEYDLVANPIDAKSGAKMETEKYKLWFIKENFDKIKALHQGMGVKFKPPEMIPETTTELELYDERGGFKPDFAKEMEKISAHTFAVSDWDVIKDMVLGDAIDLGIMSCQEYYDEEDNFYKTKYIDPENLVIQHSKYYDFRDAEFGGYFFDTTISQIRPKLLNEGYTEKEIEGIAKNYSGYSGNPEIADWADKIKAKSSEQDGVYGYDFYKVCVFSAEWIELDGKQQLKHINKGGRSKLINQNYGKKNKENKNNETVITKDRFKYSCCWVVNTNMAYDYGKAYDNLRPTKKSVALSYHVYKLPTARSITDQLIPLYDNMMILWVKYQQAISQAKNQGYAINYDSISNISAGGTDGTKSSEDEVLRRFLQTGVLIFKETNAMNVRNTNMKPVYDLPGGMGSIFIEIQEGFNMNIKMVEQLTGISPLTLGSVDPNAPVTTSMESVATTQDTIRNLIMGYMKLKQKVGQNTVLWTQLKLRNGDKEFEKAYQSVIGKNGIKALKLAEGDGAVYGINLQPQPTDLEKKEIFESAKISLANGRDGKPGITESDYFSILHILSNGGSLKLAEMVLEHSIRRSQKEADLRAKENMKMQQDGAVALKNADFQREMAKIKAESEAIIKQEYAKAMFEVMIKNPDQQMKAAEMKELETYYNILTQQQTAQQPPNQQQL